MEPKSQPVGSHLERKLAAVFPNEGLRDAARSQLMRYAADSSDVGVGRVRLAILKLSNGDLTRLDRFVDLAEVDYRDVLALAEYPAYMKLEPGIDPSSPQAQVAMESDRLQYEEWMAEG